MSDSRAATAFARTARFAQFLRAAVAIKSKTITEVATYPTVLWFADFPLGVESLRSPLLGNGWGEDDARWLVASRLAEPELPAPPRICLPWLAGVALADPHNPPALALGSAADTQQAPAPPTDEAQSRWTSYVAEEWVPWAERVKVVRQVKPIYQKLFAAHQELQGRDDAYDLFVGVGLLNVRSNEDGDLRRHLLAFPAELTFDSHSGTLTVQPAADFDRAHVELDFLPTPARASLQKRMGEFEAALAEVGPCVHQRDELGRLVAGMVHSLHPDATYVDAMGPQGAAPLQIRASFAPALILRPRSTRSLDALLAGIEQGATAPTPTFALASLTAPWLRLLGDEGAWTGEAEAVAGVTAPPEVPHFPLPSNEEQSKIIRYAAGTAGVVVQGPPGTGKSHTIANLISHYLATGRRVLVTAEKAQALQVLKAKLPTDLQALCVSLLGAGGTSDKDLERSVKGILTRHQETDDPSVYARRASKLETELAQAEARLAAHERVLHDARLAETVTLSPVPGYMGTRGAIARRLHAEKSALGWIEDAIPHECACPQFEFGWTALAAYHASLDQDTRLALAKRWVELPFPADYALRRVNELCEARRELAACVPPPSPVPDTLTVSDIEAAAGWLTALQTHEGIPYPQEAPWMEALRRSVLRGDFGPWAVLLTDATSATDRFDDRAAADTTPVEVANGRTRGQARRDVTRLAEHFGAGGRRRRLLFFKPRVVTDTEWVEQGVTLEGSPLTTPADVERARRALDGWALLDAAWRAWAEWPTDRSGSPRQQIALLRRRLATLRAHQELVEGLGALPAAVRAWMASAADGELQTRQLLDACRWWLAKLKVRAALRHVEELVLALEPLCATPDVTPGLLDIRDALAASDPAGLVAAIKVHDAEREQRERHAAYVTFCTELRKTAPTLADTIQTLEGTPSMAPGFPQFEAAWAHRCASGWLQTVLSSERVEATDRAARDQRARIQELRAEITAARAWYHGLSRIDDRKRSALVGWTTAVAKIPKTGLSVFRKRAVARSFLGRCLDTIPAWVVSLGRLYETAEARPGLFDVAIVDEASQCSLDSLVLLFLAKQIIVVGDDKQISPMVVGVKDGEVERLANAYLPDFHDRGLFTIDSSLFDHARRYLPASVPLREHFRSVSEIIRFSNELCYADNPLIPLRSPGRDRLAPLKAVFVPDGLRNGDINEAEAVALVEQLVRCHEDPAYEDCDFGVICLQGEDQASRIQHLLLERLGPSVFAERRLRCGNPYAFQGDERDVIFLSMVAATNVQNATLTKGTFEQRFNVAMSRAKDQAWLFHSVRQQDLGPLCLRRQVIDFFYQPPEQFIGGVPLDIPHLRLTAVRADRSIENRPAPFDSWFEVDVALALDAQGYRLSAQVPIAKRRIDLVIEGDGVRLAVECDGEEWHGPDRYMEDLFRQRQLERAGLRFVRVREGLFYSDQARAIAEVRAACEELDLHPGSGRPRPPQEPSPVVRSPEANSSAGSDTTDLSDPDTGEDADESTAEEDGPRRTEWRSFDEPRAQGRLELTLAQTERDGPFTGYGTKDYPDPRSAAPPNVRDAVLDIVRLDGPLSKASIYRLYRDGCPQVERAGKYLKQAINRAVAGLERAGKLETRDEGTDKAPEEVIVRLAGTPWVQPRFGGTRTLEEIPPSELAERFRAVGAATSASSGAERLAVFRRVARDYGVMHLRRTALPLLERAWLMARGAHR